MNTKTDPNVQFYPQSGHANAAIAPMASGQAPPGGTPPVVADNRSLLQKILMEPKEPYPFASEAYARAQAKKGQYMTRAFGGGFVVGVVAEAINQFRSKT